MKDRVSRFKGRVKLTPVSGQENIYDMTRADQPTEEGTPLSSETLCSFDTESLYLYNLSNATPNDIFQKIHQLLLRCGISSNTNTAIYVSSNGSDSSGNGTFNSPYKTINNAISSLPKNLNGVDYEIIISAGTYSESVEIESFYGGGSLTLRGTSSSSKASIYGSGTDPTIKIRRCECEITLRYLNIDITGNKNGVLIEQCANRVLIQNCSSIITGSTAQATGVYANSSKNVYVLSSFFAVCYRAIVSYNSIVTCGSCSGGNNTTVFYANNGAVIRYYSNSMSGTTLKKASNGSEIYG